jgi:low affinity Fe/Cu permease
MQPRVRATVCCVVDPTRLFTAFANAVSRWAGRPPIFVVCILAVAAWAITGPIFGYSDTWQLVINTSTTIVTFLMVFLIQNTQNRDNAALQAKLDELIRVTNAKNGFIGIERLTDKELEKILEDFETEKATPLGRKSQIIDSKARAARAKKGVKEDKSPGRAVTTAKRRAARAKTGSVRKRA